MADGLKFMIELDNKISGGTPADQKLRQVEEAANKANRAVSHGSHEFSALKSDITNATVAGQLWAKGMEMGAEFVKHKIEQVGEVIKETVNIAAGERREQMAMTNLLGGREDAEKALHYLDRFGDLSEFNEEKTKAFGMELLNSGYAGQKWKDAMAAVADVASMSVDKIAGASEAVSAFSKMEMSGKLDARILKGLRLNVKDVMKDLGDALGMSPKAVEKALNEGAVPAAKSFEAVLGALEKKTGKRLGEAGLDAGKGLDAKLTHLREFPEKIMKAVANSPGMNMIEKGFDKMLKAFDPTGPKGSAMVDGLGKLMNSVGKFMNEAKWDAVGKSIGGIATSLGAWVEPLGKVAELMLKVTEGIAKLPKIGEAIADTALEVFEPGKAAEFDEKKQKLKIDEIVTKIREERALKQADAAAATEQADSTLERVMGRNLIDFDITGLNGGGSGNGGTHVEAKADVVVQVSGGTGSPKEVQDAVKAGTEEGMTKALEKTAIQRGTASARRKR